MSYIGEQVNNVKANKGLYTPSEILELTKDGSWGGSLQLVASANSDNSSQTLAFDNCFTDAYNSYLIQWKNFVPANDENMLYFRFKNSGGEISSGYKYAMQEGNSAGSFSESKSTSATYLRVMGGGGSGTGENANGFIYVYNPTNSAKLTTINIHSTSLDQNSNGSFVFGGGVRPTADSVTGAMFRNISSGGTLGNINTLNVAIYGLKDI